MKKIAVLALAAVLLTTASCAPPKEKYQPGATSSGVYSDQPYTPVELDETEYEKQAQILTVRLSDYVNRREEIVSFSQFYERGLRYALVCVIPTGQRTNRWFLFCYETNEVSVLIDNAALTNVVSKDDFTFLHSGYDAQKSRYDFPSVTRVLRHDGELLRVDSSAWLPLTQESRIGAVTDSGAPKTDPVMPLLNQIHLTENSVQLAFLSSDPNASGDPPHCSVSADENGQSMTLVFTGVSADGSLPKELTGSSSGLIRNVSLRGYSTKVVVTVTVNDPTLLYQYCPGGSYPVGNDRCTPVDLRFCPADAASGQTL